MGSLEAQALAKWKDLEARAFILWKVEATDSYKRFVIVELIKLIKLQANQSDIKLYNELKKICINLTKVELDCALSSLYMLGVIGIHPVQSFDGEARHVNFKRKNNTRVWKKYLSYIRVIQPEAV